MANKNLYCEVCKNLVLILVEGSKIKKGVSVFCKNCKPKRKINEEEQYDIPDFLKGIFK